MHMFALVGADEWFHFDNLGIESASDQHELAVVTSRHIHSSCSLPPAVVKVSDSFAIAQVLPEAWSIYPTSCRSPCQPRTG